VPFRAERAAYGPSSRNEERARSSVSFSFLLSLSEADARYAFADSGSSMLVRLAIDLRACIVYVIVDSL